MDVVGMRFVGAWAEHGREPAATGFADRIDCSASITWGLRPVDGERRAVREFETQNICRNSERVGAQLPAFSMVAVAAFITSDMNGLEICPRRAAKTGATTSPSQWASGSAKRHATTGSSASWMRVLDALLIAFTRTGVSTTHAEFDAGASTATWNSKPAAVSRSRHS